MTGCVVEHGFVAQGGYGQPYPGFRAITLQTREQLKNRRQRGPWCLQGGMEPTPLDK
jgi:hypothetical protein